MTIRLKKITKRWAARHGACRGAKQQLFRLFPDGLDLSDAEDVRTAWQTTWVHDIAWFLIELGVLPCYRRGHNHAEGEPCDVPFDPDGQAYYTKRQMRPIAKKAGLPL